MERDIPDMTGIKGNFPASGRDPAFVEGVSPSTRALEVVIRELAQSPVPVLLLAEGGAGKRATAQRIHQLSGRSAEPFVLAQCSAMLPSIFDGPGLLGQGTVYLEELGDLSSECQARLLEMLPQVEESRPDGNSARLIFGSARDLEAEMRSGRFREDLYYRISGV